MHEAYLALALGILASFITSFLKKRFPEMDGRVTQLAVFAVCLVIAVIVTVIRQYAPPEMLTTLGTSFAAAVAWYEVAIKKQS